MDRSKACCFLVGFLTLSTARGDTTHASTQQVGTSVVQNKRSITNDNAAAALGQLTTFNGFGAAVPLNFGAYGMGFPTYNPGVGLPTIPGYGFGMPATLHDFGIGFRSNLGNPAATFAAAPLGFEHSAIAGAFGYNVAPATAGYQFPLPAAPPKTAPAATSAQPQAASAGNGRPSATRSPVLKTLLGSSAMPQPQYANQAAKPGQNYRANAQQAVPHSANGRAPSPNGASQQYQQQVSAGTANVPGETTAAIFQPSVDGAGVTAAVMHLPSSGFVSGAAQLPNLYLELRPPPYSEQPYDYSKSVNRFAPATSAASASAANAAAADGSHNDFGFAGAETQQPHGHTAALSGVPNAFLFHTVGGFGVPVPMAGVPYPVSRFAYPVSGNPVYQESTAPVGGVGGGVSGGVGVDVAAANSAVPSNNGPYRQSDASGGQSTEPSVPYSSNSISANTYSESNSIQNVASGSIAGGNAKLFPNNNYYSDTNTISVNVKRETPKYASPSKSTLHIAYFSNGGVYKKKTR